MALFGRKKKDTVPKEIKEYYQAEKRERAGLAWLLAFATLAVTLLLAAGLFFGGRWAYRAIFDDDNTETAQEEGLGEGADNTNQPAATTGEQNDDNESPDETPTELPGDSAEPAADDEEAETPAQTPTTGPLPSTGPDLPL